MNDLRLKKVESLLREEISLLIITRKIKDPRISTFISITGIKISKDLAYAKIGVSGIDDESLKKSVMALNHAAGFIQQKIGKRLKMRATPKLTFEVDNTIKEGFELSKKIEDLT